MQLNISASNYLGRNFACAGHGGTPSVVLAASMLGSPPPSTQRCCLTTEVSLSRTQGDPRAKNLEISQHPVPKPDKGNDLENDEDDPTNE